MRKHEIIDSLLSKGGAKPTFPPLMSFLFCSCVRSGFGEKDLGEVPLCWLLVGVTCSLLQDFMCCVKKIVQTLKLLIFLFTCAFILLCMENFPSKQLNVLINEVTFCFAVIRQITAAGPPFCDLSSFMCLHSRCLFMVCFWTIIVCGCFFTCNCY